MINISSFSLISLILSPTFLLNWNRFKIILKSVNKKEIWNENHEFLVERHIYCSDFFDFVLNLASNL